MQNVSKEYKDAMKKPFRNRGYISARIGIVSSIATENVLADDSNNDFAYFANNTAPFKDNTAKKIYATMEQDFPKLMEQCIFCRKNILIMIFITTEW